MSLFWKRLQESVSFSSVVGMFLWLPAHAWAQEIVASAQSPVRFRMAERLTLASLSTRTTEAPNGFRPDRVTLRPSPPELPVASPGTRDYRVLLAATQSPARKTAAPADRRAQNRKHQPGFRTSGPGLADDATPEVQDSRSLPQGLPIPNGTAPANGTALPGGPGEPMIPGEGLLLVPETLPPPARRPRLMGPAATPEAEAEMQAEEEEAPKEKPIYSVNSWSIVESPVFGTEEVTEFSQQIVSEGRWSLRPYLGLSTLYDGNVFIDSEDTEKDFILRVSPGLFFRLGNEETPIFLLANYALNGSFYLNDSSEDALDQTGKIDLRWRFAKVTVGLRAGVESASTTSIDAGGRIERTAYYAGVTSRYEPHEKVSVELNADYRITRAEGLIGATEGRVQAYLDYHFSPKLSFGLGGAVGFTEVEDGSNQNFQQASLRTTLAATGKLTLSANVGIEYRQFADGGEDATTPVFGLDGAWAVREGTNVTVGAQRRIYSSAALEAQNYAATTVFASVQQRMTDRFDLFFTAGYENLAYSAAGSDISTSREENSFLLRGGIQWHSLAWLSVGIFYEYSQNFSSGTGNRSFQRDRIGTQVNLLF